MSLFLDSLLYIWKSPTCKWATISASLRSFGGMAVTCYLPVFFQKFYPLQKSQFALSNALILSVLGLSSSILGGILSDRFEKKSLMAKAYICMFGSALAFPLIGMLSMGNLNFWWAISLLAIKVFVSSCWTSPTVTMMQNTSDPKRQGNIISAHLFYSTLA